MFKINSRQQIEDLVRGCCFFATGGGGDPEFGKQMLFDVVDCGKEINIVKTSELTDDNWTVCPYLMGPAPAKIETEEIKKSKVNYGLVTPRNQNMSTVAVEALLKMKNVKLGAVIPFELGAAATAAAIATAAWLNVPTIDGDYAGRSVPEISQILPSIMGINLLPITSCDQYGNVVTINEIINLKMIERVAKIMSLASFGLVGQATLLEPLHIVKNAILNGSLSKALEVGAIIRSAAKERIISKITTLTKAKIIFSGYVIKHELSASDGYYTGYVEIQGCDEFSSREFKIWVKNEIILSWLDNESYVAFPDLITIVDYDSFEPIIMGKLEEKNKIIALAMPAPNLLTSFDAKKVTNPQYFGFDDSFDKTIF